VLALISISNYPVTVRAVGAGEAPFSTLLFSSLLNATMTSAAALAAGHFISWVGGSDAPFSSDPSSRNSAMRCSRRSRRSSPYTSPPGSSGRVRVRIPVKQARALWL
jgi:hypothetical protein